MDESVIAILSAAGFSKRKYRGQDGTFLNKRMRLGDMPYAREHLIDGDWFLDSTIGVIEVIPDGRVQFYVEDRDYLEGPYPIGSEEGVALLKEAGVKELPGLSGDKQAGKPKEA